MLVYSTCTITPQENEEQVAWALKSFPCLRLEKQVSSLLYQCLLDRVSCLSVLKTKRKKKTPSVKDQKKVRDILHSKVNDDFNFRDLSIDVFFIYENFSFSFMWLARKLCFSDHPTLFSKAFPSIFSSLICYFILILPFPCQ